MNLAAFVFICSNLLMLHCVCGSHAAAQYSSVGRTSVLKAKCLMSRVQLCKFLLRNPSVLLALAVMWSMCVLNLSVVDKCTPRYLHEETEGSVWLCRL